MAESKRRPGRPGREPAPGERVGLSLRVTPEMKRLLDAAAASSGRSLSQEAEVRLEQSFRDEDLLPQILDMAFGPQTAGLLLLLGQCVRRVENGAKWMARASGEEAPTWTDNPWLYRQVEDAVNLVMERLRPVGEVAEPPAFKTQGFPKEVLDILRQVGRHSAGVLLQSTASPKMFHDGGAFSEAIWRRLEASLGEERNRVEKFIQELKRQGKEELEQHRKTQDQSKAR